MKVLDYLIGLHQCHLVHLNVTTTDRKATATSRPAPNATTSPATSTAQLALRLQQIDATSAINAHAIPAMTCANDTSNTFLDIIVNVTAIL